MIKSKRGDKVLSAWWIFVLAIIGVAIVLSVNIFYSFLIDIRGPESAVLADKITNCINDSKPLNENFMEAGFDIFKNCSLNKDLFAEGSKYFFVIRVISYEGSEKKGEYKFGNYALERDCLIKKEAAEAKYFPDCSGRFVEINSKSYAEIIAVSNNNGRTLAKAG